MLSVCSVRSSLHREVCAGDEGEVTAFVMTSIDMKHFQKVSVSCTYFVTQNYFFLEGEFYKILKD